MSFLREILRLIGTRLKWKQVSVLRVIDCISDNIFFTLVGQANQGRSNRARSAGSLFSIFPYNNLQRQPQQHKKQLQQRQSLA